MKVNIPNKTNQKQIIEDDDEDDIEVSSDGPSIASAKKSKIIIIVAASIVMTAIIYMIFFKGDGSKEKLEEVQTPRAANVAGSESGKSPFEIEMPTEKPKDQPELLSKPATPEIPSLPSLPVDSAANQELQIQPQQQLPTPQQTNAPSPQLPPDATQAAQIKQEQAQAPQEKPKPESNPRYAPIIVFTGEATDTIPSRGVGYDNNIVMLNQNPIDKLDKTKGGVKATYIADRAHMIAQGKLLTATLETAINTEIPGFVRAVVSRDVYAESGNKILIPKGSRLFGTYSSNVIRGQGRVEIGWTRLIRSDGVDLAISFIASDQFGRSGLNGEVDNKYGSIVTSSLLTSILAVGGAAAAEKLLGGNQNTTATTNPSLGTVTTTGRASSQALYDVSRSIIGTVGEVLGNAIDIKPVIRVAQGTKITVIVNSDISIPEMDGKDNR